MKRLSYEEKKMIARELSRSDRPLHALARLRDPTERKSNSVRSVGVKKK